MDRTDVLTPEQRSKCMKAIKGKDSKIEVRLARALWARGWRYRKNDKRLPGKPDLTFFKYKVVVFVDSEFFHGYNWTSQKFNIKSNRDFWWPKIGKNIERDKFVNSELERSGWVVLRFWGKEVKKDLEACVGLIEKVLHQRKPI